jgi:LuxR family transcriptional regulator, maltose regulon positive regulatory protein
MLSGGGNEPGEVGTVVPPRQRRAALNPSARGKSSADSVAGSLAGSLALGDQLLATKLYAPSTRAGLTARPRLTERLDEAARIKLTLVVAPAGFGKSTLLGEWVLQSDLPVGWLALDEGDNDPAGFLRYVIAAIRTVEPEIGEDALSLLRSPQQSPTRAVSTMLVNGLAAVPHDLALILDDYHAIENEAVHATLAFLLEHLPPQMHLVIASRTDPPLQLARFLAGGQLTKLTASHLRFTNEEAVTFLDDKMGLELSAEHVATLEEKTEGWIAGLQLAALSLRGREDASGFISAFTGTNRYVLDYLVEEVLDKQDEGTREFLYRTSILDRLSGPLCDAVTGRGEGQTKLEELERANLLITALDDKRRWYRYHHLFSDFLRERLRRESPEMVSDLHLRASDWHERNGTAGEAVAHALAAEDYERTGDLIERLADSMLGRGETPVLVRLLRALPEEVIRSRPGLYIWYVIFVLMDGERLDAAEAALLEVEWMLGIEVQTASGGSPPALATTARDDKQRAIDEGVVATVRANIAQEKGDLRSSIGLNRRALELLPEEGAASKRAVPAINIAECLLDLGDVAAARGAIDDAIEVGYEAGEHAHIAWSLCLLGHLHVMQGRLSCAIRAYERVLRFADEPGGVGVLLEMGAAHVGMGEVLLERNDLQTASRHLVSGVELVLEWLGLGEATSRLLGVTEAHDRLGRLEEVDFEAAQVVVPGYIGLARVRQAQGDAEGGFEALRKVEQVAHNAHVTPLRRNRSKTWVAAWRARLRVMEGDLGAAERWAKERRLSADDDLDYSPESELEYATLARLLVAQGKHEEASRLLERLLEAAETGGRERTVIEVLVLKAQLLRTQNDGPAALAVLKRALMLAEPEGYVRTFADEGRLLTGLLRRVLKEQRKSPADIEGDVTPKYVGELLDALGATTAAPTKVHVRGPAELLLDPITERELEVLELLDSDLSNREIAAKLFVSLATIKSHTKHLYRKLGVRARHQAVARGKELGLL